MNTGILKSFLNLPRFLLMIQNLPLQFGTLSYAEDHF